MHIAHRFPRLQGTHGPKCPRTAWPEVEGAARQHPERVRPGKSKRSACRIHDRHKGQVHASNMQESNRGYPGPKRAWTAWPGVPARATDSVLRPFRGNSLNPLGPLGAAGQMPGSVPSEWPDPQLPCEPDPLTDSEPLVAQAKSRSASSALWMGGTRTRASCFLREVLARARRESASGVEVLGPFAHSGCVVPSW